MKIDTKSSVAGCPIPFVDLVNQHELIKDQLMQMFEKVLEGASFIGGRLLEDFEKEFARFTQNDFAVGVSSGTDALRFALIAVGVKANDHVITVPNTFIATTEAISQAGGCIDFVDVDQDTCLMDPNLLEDFLAKRFSSGPKSARPVAIVPVHLYGQIADMDAIINLARSYEIAVIEDAAQAHGATYKGRPAGSFGDAAAFSFYPAKNLGACGEAGAVVTNRSDLAEKVRIIRDHGQTAKYHHVVEGYNGRLDAIQAGILSLKLPFLNRWNELRRTIALKYDNAFKDLEWVRPVKIHSYNTPSRHLYVIHIPERDNLRGYLHQRNISTGLHYPIALHLQECYMNLCFSKGDFPRSEHSADHVLSLPIFPELQEDQVERICYHIKDFGGDI